jgi:non-heme chloroperoxidase
MSKTDFDLEILSRHPAINGHRRNAKPPLLFVHGGYCDAWCWDFNFLPYFSRRGYAAHAVSLRGHGASDGKDALSGAGLDDYAEDVVRAARKLGGAPVLIGHSMGATVVERALAGIEAPAAALLAPVPPTGLFPIAMRLMGLSPGLFWHLQHLDGTNTSLHSLAALRSLYFTDAMPRETLAQLVPHLHAESPRAVFEMSLPASRRPHGRAPEMIVMGAENDALFTPSHVAASARRFDVEAVILPDLPHMFMLEPGWEAAAMHLADWLDARFA